MGERVGGIGWGWSYLKRDLKLKEEDGVGRKLVLMDEEEGCG